LICEVAGGLGRPRANQTDQNKNEPARCNLHRFQLGERICPDVVVRQEG
jgi:hypothetical protein